MSHAQLQELRAQLEARGCVKGWTAETITSELEAWTDPKGRVWILELANGGEWWRFYFRSVSSSQIAPVNKALALLDGIPDARPFRTPAPRNALLDHPDAREHPVRLIDADDGTPDELEARELEGGEVVDPWHAAAAADAADKVGRAPSPHVNVDASEEAYTPSLERLEARISELEEEHEEQETWQAAYLGRLERVRQDVDEHSAKIERAGKLLAGVREILRVWGDN